MAIKTNSIALNSDDRLIREKECRKITGLSRQTRWSLEKTGDFPKRIKMGSRTIAWRMSEVQEWMDSLAESRGES
jgi:prophage regulatory protein